MFPALVFQIVELVQDSCHLGHLVRDILVKVLLMTCFDKLCDNVFVFVQFQFQLFHFLVAFGSFYNHHLVDGLADVGLVYSGVVGDAVEVGLRLFFGYLGILFLLVHCFWPEEYVVFGRGVRYFDWALLRSTVLIV